MQSSMQSTYAERDELETLVREVIEKLDGKYYGKYRAFVAANNDPEQRGRLRLRVPSLLGATITDWALPCVPYGGLSGQGLFLIPEPDAQVWVEFEAGELSHPIWSGGFWQRAVGELADFDDNNAPTTRALRTPAGSALRFAARDGGEHIELNHPDGAHLAIAPDDMISLATGNGTQVHLDGQNGAITITDGNNNTLSIDGSGITVSDASGNTIQSAADGITVSGQRIVVQGSQVMLGGEAGEPLIRGQSFLSLFASHIHPTPAGPSSAPVPQGEFGTLTTVVTAE